MMTTTQRYNCFVRYGGNAIPKHPYPEAKGSNTTTGLSLRWDRNPFRWNSNHWHDSQEEAGRILPKTRHGNKKLYWLRHLWFSEQSYCSAVLWRVMLAPQHDDPRQRLELSLQRITESPRSLCLVTSFSILLSHLQSYKNGVRWIRNFLKLSPCVQHKLHLKVY